MRTGILAQSGPQSASSGGRMSWYLQEQRNKSCERGWSVAFDGLQAFLEGPVPKGGWWWWGWPEEVLGLDGSQPGETL